VINCENEQGLHTNALSKVIRFIRSLGQHTGESRAVVIAMLSGVKAVSLNVNVCDSGLNTRMKRLSFCVLSTTGRTDVPLIELLIVRSLNL
jgi:hypothetical protein